MYTFALKLKKNRKGTKRKNIGVNFQNAIFYLYLIEDGSQFLCPMLVVYIFDLKIKDYDQFRFTNDIYCGRWLVCDKKEKIIAIIYHCGNLGKTYFKHVNENISYLLLLLIRSHIRLVPSSKKHHVFQNKNQRLKPVFLIVYLRL